MSLALGLGLAQSPTALAFGAVGLAASHPNPSGPEQAEPLARLALPHPLAALGGPPRPVSFSSSNPIPSPDSRPGASQGRTADWRADARADAAAAPNPVEPAAAQGDGSLLVVAGDGFAGWHSLNDTIMGGRSQGSCRSGSTGLVMTAEVVAEGGGFVSCRSPLFSPPLDLSTQAGLQLELEGDGRRYKLAIACSDGLAGLTELIPGGLRWVAEFGTEAQGVSRVWIPFSQLRPSVRAKPVGLPLRFDPARITRLQILHSRFGDDGGVNSGFRAGPLSLTIHAIRALP